jgi:hypothetical protein
MGGFYKASELIRRNHSDSLVAFPAHDHNFVIIGHAVQH